MEAQCHVPSRIKYAVFIAIVLIAGCASEDKHSGQSQKDAEDAKFEAAIAAMNAKDPILPDDTLIRRFRKHRATFEQLRQMILSDSRLYRVDVDWTDPQNPADIGISAERIALYRRLLASVGCRRGFYHYPAGDGIYFVSGTSGLAISGTSKEYCYLEGFPATIATNTATYKSPNPYDEYKVYRQIEGHWFIYFDSF